MRKYENVFIIKPEVDEAGVATIIAKFKAIIEANGEMESVDEWGKRRLAYEIQDYTEGYYVLFNFKAGDGVPKELDRVFRITEDVIRHMVIRVDE